MKHRNVVLAAILIVLANAWALVSVRLNRGDAPGGTVELTERELRLVRVSDESTVVFLEIEWDTLRSASPGETGRREDADWLDAAKMVELGFPPQPASAPADDARLRYRCYTAPVYVVLEFEGEAWRQAPTDRRQTTRLFAMDAGRDAQLLRQRYPDPTRYIISRALIRSVLQRSNSPDGKRLQPHLRGSLSCLVPGRIFLSRPHYRVLANLPVRDRDLDEHSAHEPRFTAIVSWGNDYAPWLRDVRLRSNHSAPP